MYKRPGKPVTHRPIMCVETGYIYKTYKEAALAINKHESGVQRAATGTQRHCGGYHFIFVD